MDETWKHVLWKKPNTKDHESYNPVSMKCLGKENPKTESRWMQANGDGVGWEGNGSACNPVQGLCLLHLFACL